MRTLIAYATKHGCTEECASKLEKKISGEIDLVNLKKNKQIDISKYDKVIIGGSIYIGKIQKEVNEFCNNNLNQLKEKKTGLFICCMQEEDTAKDQLKNSFPEELYSSADARGIFGGKFILKKMNFFERMIVKKVSKVTEDQSNILEKNIDEFARLMNDSC